MDAKEIKSALKAAREAIKTKEYKEAVKHCKSVLKHDKSNYNALVFVGVAAEGMEQAEQAVMAYTRATEAQPDQPLAWQGLCGFYEKSSSAEHKKPLLAVYERLTILYASEEQKKWDVQVKMAQVLVEMKLIEEVAELYMRMVGSADEDEQKKMFAYRQLIILYAHYEKQLEKYSIEILEGFRNVLPVADNSEEYNTLWKSYIYLILKTDVHAAQTECLNYVEDRGDDILPLEILCRINLDAIAAGDETAADILYDYTDRLEAVSKVEDSVVLCVAKAACSLLKGDPATTKTLLRNRKDTFQVWSHHIYLCRALLMMHDELSALEVIKKGLSELKNTEVRFLGDLEVARKCLILLMATASAGAGYESRTEGISACNKMLEFNVKDTAALICLAKIHLAADDIQLASETIETCLASEETAILRDMEGWCLFLQDNNAQSIESLQRAVELAPQLGSAHYHLGRLYWQKSLTDQAEGQLACKYFLQSAKLDPFYSDTFLYLGHCYQILFKTPSKAQRCYQKALQLSPNSEEAGIAYVDILRETQQDELAVGVLKRVTQEATTGSGKWAWLRLGLHQMKHDDPSKAIASLQAALRAQPTDVHCWECLGEAYLNRGSFTAALKAFTKASQLDESAVYPQYQLANIQQALGQLHEAVKSYTSLLATNPDYVPALKGLGETHLLLARAALKQCFHVRAVYNCEQTLKHLTRAAGSRPDLSCLWKLMGDAAFSLSSLDPEFVKVSVPAKLVSQHKQSDVNEYQTLDEQALLALSTRCYGMALKQQQECASLWHDLGLSYMRQAELTEKMSAHIFAGKAFRALNQAVTLEPTNHRIWNTLGLLCVSKEGDNKALAQHCFLKAISGDQNNAVAWTNLGALYLKSDNVQLGHEAFKIAQSLDPGYVECWVGQAMIAETIGHDDAMDLFRHSTQLANHMEGALGYGHWTCQRFMSHDSKSDTETAAYSNSLLSAITTASDALDNYTDRIKQDAQAFNMHGLLLEKQGLMRKARVAFSRAIELLGESKDNDKVTKACKNYARILCFTKNADEAVTYYSRLDQNDFAVVCGLALAFYNSQQYTESMNAYQSAINLAPNDEQRAHVQAAIGMAAYKAGDLDASKTALFKCSQMAPVSVSGLQALLALGLLQHDATLAAAVMEELKKHKNSSAQANMQQCTLQAALNSMQAISMIQQVEESVHEQPADGQLWLLLARLLLLQDPQQQSQAAQQCTLTVSDVSKRQEAMLYLSLSILSTGEIPCSQAHHRNSALKAAQTAVHTNPGCLASWCVLLTAMFAEHMVKAPDASDRGSSMLTLGAHIMAQVEGELKRAQTGKERLQELHLWSVKQYVLALLTADRRPEALHFLQQAAWLYENDPVLQGLSAAFNQNFSGLKTVAQISKNTYCWQLLTSLYSYHGLESELQDCIKLWLHNVSDNKHQVEPLLRFAQFALKKRREDVERCDEWQSQVIEYGGEAVKRQSTCAAAHFVQGLATTKDKNRGKCRRSFQKALEHGVQSMLVRHLSRHHLAQIYIEKADDEAMKTLLAGSAKDGEEERVWMMKLLGIQDEDDSRT